MSTVTIRAAVADEALQLTDLALRSKAHWGYSTDFIDACRTELTITPERLDRDSYYCFVAVHEGDVSGFAAIERVSSASWELDALFVEPCKIGTGIGRALMEHAKSTVLDRGGTSLIIQGDPHAEKFYVDAGAVRIGVKTSGSIPGRVLPVFEIALAR